VVGPVSNALDGADISFAVGFVVAAAVYYPLRRRAAQPSVPTASPTASDEPEQEPASTSVAS
jgi:NCS1 family nucleobase:cation symporter-1